MKKSTKVFKCSDPNDNIYGFSVESAGIKLDSFLLNPVCLLNHNYDKVMGTWDDVTLMGKDLQGVPVFDTEDEEANKYYGKVEREMIKGASIGIIPLSMKGNIITTCDLLEISITPVPANRNALVIYNAKGVKLNVSEAKAYVLSVQNSNNVNHNQLKKMDKELIAALVLLCAQSGISVQLSGDSKTEDAVGAIQKIGNKIASLELSNTQLKAANDQYKTKEEAAINLEATTAVDAAIADKRILVTQRENFLKLFAADAELAKTTLEALKPVILSVVPGAEKAKETADDLKERESWTFDDYAEKASVELAAMQTNDPEKFKKLYDAKVVKLKAAGAIA